MENLIHLLSKIGKFLGIFKIEINWGLSNFVAKNKMKTFVRVYFTIVTILLISTVSYGQYDSIQFDGYDRTYLLHLPDSYSGTDTLPLIIAMHGGFGSAYNLQDQSLLSEKADEENFIVVYPEGLENGILNIRTWNAGWCCGNASSSNVDDVGFINALLDTLISQYSIDTNRIYATGMSNGGFMSYRLACELSDRIAAIAPVAASMSMYDCNPERPVPIIEFHSYLDENVPYYGGIGSSGFSDHWNPPQDSVMNAWANKDTCLVLNDTIVNNGQYTFIKWGNCSCLYEVHHYVTEDGGHSWPGGTQGVIGDPVSIYINATDLLWSFFQQYSLECETVNYQDENTYKDIYFDLFPNPSVGIININTSLSSAKYTIEVYNITGKLIVQIENKNVIDLSDQMPGIYFALIQTEKQIITQKIIIR